MNSKRLFIIFFSVLLIECIANAAQILPVQFVSKPALMLILIFYFRNRTRNLPDLKNLILLALIFSWLGDVLLLIEKSSRADSFLFVYGLASFLIAHLFYIVYFWRIRRCNISEPEFNPVPIAGVLIYAGAFYFLIYDFLSFLKIPVLLYCLIISLMLITSFRAFDLRRSSYGKLCIAGTVLFALSDSILAVDRFVVPLPLGGVFVILTYAVGQFLIMKGALLNLRKIDLK
jgi:uncharacterized membrane protein YhhN